MNPTKIISNSQEVKLYNTLSYLTPNYEKVNLGAKDTVNVNISNAIRFSKKDNGEITVTRKPDSDSGKDPKKLDYELDDEKSFTTSNVLDIADDRVVMYEGTDTQARIYEIANEGNLGSYATTYNGDDQELNRLYNSDYNAMWTYYQSLGAGSDDVKPLNYEALKSLYDDGIIYNTLADTQKVTKLDSGLKAHKVTFRFWLEGYDADYFAGVSGLESMKCNLSFKVNSRLT